MGAAEFEAKQREKKMVNLGKISQKAAYGNEHAWGSWRTRGVYLRGGGQSRPSYEGAMDLPQ